MKILSLFVGQKALIKKRDEVLVVNDPHAGLDYPGGKIQEEESDLMESLRREVREETGLEIKVGSPFTTWLHILPAHHKHAGRKVLLIAYRCEYVSGEVKLSNDHNRFSWVSKSTYKTMDNDTPYYEVLNKYFNA